MIPLVRLTSLWSWLPAFRAVAETENVHEAARRLHVTPSALSRSVRLVEQDVGVPLFERVGRNVRLTREGQRLLVAVRDAMRSVDDGVTDVVGPGLGGVSGIVCEGDYAATCLARALVDLHATHGIVGHIDTHWCAEVPGMLLRGELDVAFVRDPPRGRTLDAELTVAPVAPLAFAVYCGRGHPLWKREGTTCADVLEHPFVGLAVDATNAKHAGRSPWPPELARTVGLYAASVHDAMTVCASGRLLAVLPRAAVREQPRLRLHRLPEPRLPSLMIHAVSRKPLSDVRTRASLIIEAMRGALSAPHRAS